jgi:hypothetical protein
MALVLEIPQSLQMRDICRLEPSSTCNDVNLDFLPTSRDKACRSDLGDLFVDSRDIWKRRLISDTLNTKGKKTYEAEPELQGILPQAV